VLLLKKTAVICWSLLLLWVLFPSHGGPYDAASVMPRLVPPHKDSGLPKSDHATNIVALAEAEDSALVSRNSPPLARISEKQSANAGVIEAVSANQSVSFSEFTRCNCDLVLNL
jgi:hypothetical protein